MTRPDVLSALGGVVFGGLNFWLLVRIVRGIAQSPQNTKDTKKGRIVLLFFLKMGLLLGTFGLILKGGYVTPLPFLAGFTVSLIAGIVIKIIKSPKS